MYIFLNGEEKQVRAPLNVSELLELFNLEPKKIAVERNREIVPKSLYDKTAVDEGDQIEIVQFVGGG